MGKIKFLQGAVAGFVVSTTVLLSTTAFVSKYDMIDKKPETIGQAKSEYYVGDIDTDKMEQGIYKGFVAAVGDPYTT